MSLLNILQYPDARLKKVATTIAVNDIASTNIQTIIADMFETMYQAAGVGLAAIQVNIPLQIITIDISETRNTPICLINPNITATKHTINSNEGCLSFPGVYANIQRSKIITVEFFDMHGTNQILHADDLLSICIQHEIDHLAGKTFFDHLSLLKQTLLAKKLKKLRKHNL
jgi:peptide deformylase